MNTTPNKLVIIDLDETLVHATKDRLTNPFDFQFDNYFVYKRPYLEQFLVDISKHFTLGIWSSAGDEYVNEITRNIKPDNVDFYIVWGRSKCSMKRDTLFDTYCFEKRLDKLKKKGFSLEHILIVDDTPSKSRTNYGNAIYIKEFLGDQDDRELLLLHEYLLTLKTVDNVRNVEKRLWRSEFKAEKDESI